MWQWFFSIMGHHSELWCNQSTFWRLQFPLVMIKAWWKVHIDVIPLPPVMTFSISLSFVWKLMGLWIVGFKDCKISKTAICRSMKFSKNLLHRDMWKLQSLVFLAFTVFEQFKILRGAGLKDLDWLCWSGSYVVIKGEVNLLTKPLH